MTQPLAPQIVAGPPGFLTISTVQVANTPTGFQVTFDTDQACEIQMAWWPTQFPNTGPGVSGGPSDSSPVTHHVLGVNIGTSAAGQSYQFVLQLAAGDVSGLLLRPYQGTALVQAKFNRTTPAVPVRFYNFGGTPPPPAGGGGQGNWSTYAWAQWNPKGTSFPN